jgi:hypothetical protein
MQASRPRLSILIETIVVRANGVEVRPVSTPDSDQGELLVSLATEPGASVYPELQRLQEVATLSSRRQTMRSRRWSIVRVVLGVFAVGASAVAAFFAVSSQPTAAAACSAAGAFVALVALLLNPGRRAQFGVGAATEYRGLAERAERVRLFDPGPGDPAAARLVAEGLEQLKLRLDAEAARSFVLG